MELLQTKDRAIISWVILDRRHKPTVTPPPLPGRTDGALSLLWPYFGYSSEVRWGSPGTWLWGLRWPDFSRHNYQEPNLVFLWVSLKDLSVDWFASFISRLPFSSRLRRDDRLIKDNKKDLHLSLPVGDSPKDLGWQYLDWLAAFATGFSQERGSLLSFWLIVLGVGDAFQINPLKNAAPQELKESHNSSPLLPQHSAGPSPTPPRNKDGHLSSFLRPAPGNNWGVASVWSN